MKTNFRDVIPADYLRSISVPIISHQECANIYGHRFPITDRHICTLDRNHQKRCSRDDLGAPLVLFSRLVGVLIFAGDIEGPGFPDIFVNLQYPIYEEWIKAHLTQEIRERQEQRHSRSRTRTRHN